MYETYGPLYARGKTFSAKIFPENLSGRTAEQEGEGEEREEKGEIEAERGTWAW